MVAAFLKSESEGGEEAIVENVSGHFLNDFASRLALKPLLKTLDGVMGADLVEVLHGGDRCYQRVWTLG